MKKYWLIICFTFTGFISVYSQNREEQEQLAYQFLQNQEYEKAADIFEKLFKKDLNPSYYAALYECYVQLETFSEAEKLVKKQIKRFPQANLYYIDLGWVYELSGNESKANNEYQKAIKNLPPSSHEVIKVADNFKYRKKYDLAIETYLRGKKLVHNYPFTFELGELYLIKKDIPAVLNEYLDVLSFNPGYIQQVQNALQTILNDDPNQKRKDLLKSMLLKRIQSKNNDVIFNEMLIWLFIQEKDFEGALIQAKALDKRNDEDGQRIIKIAQLARANYDFDEAINCYEYVISKGDGYFYFLQSKINLVQCLNEKILFTNNYTLKDLTHLEKQYYSTLEELGNNYRTIELSISLAHLQAFYLDKADTAIVLLEECLKFPRAKELDIAKAKLELGDILVFQNNIWDAVLYFGQVESAYKHDIIGHEAKFRKARVYYYSGDFEWAKTQLNVLKASTSKLIANDAMKLSLLITDNTGLDTNLAPVIEFAYADLLIYQKVYDKALIALDSILINHPTHLEIKDDIYFKMAYIKEQQGDYEKAIQYYQKNIDLKSALSDEALLRLGFIYEFKLQQTDTAQEYYKTILLSYPGSIHSVIARKRFRYLRGDWEEATDDLFLNQFYKF